MGCFHTEFVIADEVDASAAACYLINQAAGDAAKRGLLSKNYNWSIEILGKGPGFDGSPLITLEINNNIDPLKWCAYFVKDEELEQADPHMIILDEIFPTSHFRICVAPNGTTGGTITIKLVIKSNT